MAARSDGYRGPVPSRLEDLKPGVVVTGVAAGEPVTVVAAEWHGSSCVTLTYRRPSGGVDHRLVFRSEEEGLTVDGADGGWAFDADGALFRLAAEARRVRLAYLFDPRLAVHHPGPAGGPGRAHPPGGHRPQVERGGPASRARPGRGRRRPAQGGAGLRRPGDVLARAGPPGRAGRRRGHPGDPGPVRS